MKTLLAACDNPFGCITPPIAPLTDPVSGMIPLFNNIVKLAMVGAGLYAFINIILAGYTFLGAGGDAKKVQQAWDKISQSMIGVMFVVGSLVLAAIFGWIFFKDPTAILNPKIYGPN
jgi:hypothetical protein